MHLTRNYRKAALTLTLAGFTLVAAPVQAVTLDFSALLTTGTCSLSLDKSSLPLGMIAPTDLLPNRLVAPQPFVLSIQDCTGAAAPGLKPIVNITGNGVTQDNKWLFRNAGSAAGTGILVIQSDTLPDYSLPEIKNDAVLALGSAGQMPVNQSYTFYAGVSCGGSIGCASVGTGDVTANLMFSFAWQ